MHNFKYIYHEDLAHYNSSQSEDYLVKPLFDFSYSDLNTAIPSLDALIDPLIVAWQSNNHHNHDLYRLIWGNDVVLKEGGFYHEASTLKPFKKHQRVMLSLLLALDNGHKNVILPIDKSFLQDCSPFFIHDMLTHFDKPLSIRFVSNDKEWLSIFDSSYNAKTIYWVEGDFDKKTYAFFDPDNEYRIAENWMNVIRVVQQAPMHYGIIDKDGFLPERQKIKHIYFSRYAEAENTWLNEKLLKIYGRKHPSFPIEDFKNNVINNAIKDKEETIDRFIRRQEEQKKRNLPYVNSDIVDLHLQSYTDSLQKRNYDKIIMIYDNKAIFNQLLKSLSYKNSRAFFIFLSSIREEIKALQINPTII